MLTPSDIEALFVAAKQMAPMEMCGLMFEGYSFAFCHNADDDPAHGFEIPYHEYLAKVAEHGRAPWATVHSHPHGSAKLSGRDMLLLDAQAVVGNTMKMVIVGLQPMQIRIYARVEDPLTPYRCEWQWDIRPMEAKQIYYAVNE